MTLAERAAWTGASWVVCFLAMLNVLGWAPVVAMFVGALMIGRDD